VARAGGCTDHWRHVAVVRGLRGVQELWRQLQIHNQRTVVLERGHLGRRDVRPMGALRGVWNRGHREKSARHKSTSGSSGSVVPFNRRSFLEVLQIY
jgi:hypothetical protein